MSEKTAIQRLIELDKQKPLIKEYYENLKEALEAVNQEIGTDGFFQDLSDGTVFQIVKPSGRFIEYNDLAYIRTRREGEKRGDLSLKKAQEAGFEVE